MIAYLVLGFALLLCLYLLGRWFIEANPKDVIRVLKWGIGLLLLLLIVFLLVSGRLGWALAGLPALYVWFRRFHSLFNIGKTARSWYGQGQKEQKTTPPRDGMTRQEALAILGLEEGARPEEIKAAYHRLIAQVHPDKGGSDYLASQINQAKDILLND
ncbi:DnaJ domain-containing protein [Terasakiella sp.]|uniref:DnaJ domain-containing protein n=1 Tax=Terasakiella sp. TaxID=2034861 RepID=UPI003AA8786A